MKMIPLVFLLSPLSFFAEEIKVINSFADSRPNIIFFFVDDLGYKDLGCYGSSIIETSHIDALSKQGIKMTRAYSAAAVCSPARVAALTGKHSLPGL